ncbi:MAG: hypothetical protein NC320_00270 [Clostridium sp.]|nr:hypothetical protein [Clostridium sp.]MCM1547786.1 hypothetical protein [Ruminococcus sp.]
MNDILNKSVNSTDSVSISAMSAAETAKTQAAVNKASENIKASEEKEPRTDSYQKSPELKSSDTGIYSREALLNKLKADEEARVKAFQDTIRSMMAKQGQTVNLTFRGMDLHVTEEQRAAAEAAISEGGEYSIDSVATRIMDMAMALGGNDPTKISVLREAVQKGFGGAASILGVKDDDMPQITKDTYSEVMKRFDEWENSFKTDDSAKDESAA